MTAVEMRNVCKMFGDVDVVRDLDLVMTAGEFLILVGPSGCGKSTTLRMIAGLERPTSGDIFFDDKRVNDTPPKDRNLGMVFQSYALYPHLTVRENLSFALKLQKMSKLEIESRVNEIATRLSLETLLERRPAHLSGGQRQRVAMGRAIVRSPSLYLFDEPLSNLDAALRVKMRAELAALHARERTSMVYVTHDQVEAMTLGDRIAVMHGGKLQQIGSPSDVFRNPKNLFVAGFIGSPAMNLTNVSVHSENGTTKLRGEGLDVSLSEASAMRARLSQSGERDVVFGIRPENVRLHPDADGNTHARGRVSLVERLGFEAFVHVAVGTHTVVARTEARESERLQVGADVVLAFQIEHAHVFASTTGEAIVAMER